MSDGAWYHRVWVIDHFNVDYSNELSLCKSFLKEDQRNFHCWNYRRLVIQRAGVGAVDELAFTSAKIQENFSNYSAFHQRSVFLKELSLQPRDVLEAELSIVENAVFTEPDDQSAWWYHQFLMGWAADSVAGLSAHDREWFEHACRQQLELMRSLLEIEDTCRWVMTCLVGVIGHELDCAAVVGRQLTHPDWAVEEAKLRSERRALLYRLEAVDPMHSSRYRYMLRKLVD